jgi:four helix bundle protein
VAYQSFEQLEVWQLARKFTVDIYRALDGCRDYHFRNQITDAANSISNNIAEGSERLSRPDFIRFLGYAKGSAAEARSQLYLAADLGYIMPEISQKLRENACVISSKVFNLIRSLGGPNT